MVDIGVGADDRNRTGDLLITNQLLYQLSYVGLTLVSLEQKYSWCHVPESGYVGFFLMEKAYRTRLFAIQ
jgi:hypothetical protein